MILQALKEYYDRIAGDPESDTAQEGFEKKGLEFIIVINEKGDFINIEDTREQVGKKLNAKQFELPRSVPRSGSKSYATTFLLWDHIGYVLGLSKKDTPKNKELAKNQYDAWTTSLKESLPDTLKKDAGVAAVLLFYERKEDKKALDSPVIADCLKLLVCNMSFRLEQDTLTIIPCRPAVKEYVAGSLKSSVGVNTGVCLVTGENGEIVRTHSKTFISASANSLISFQRNSGYDSYYKEQGYNAPIIESTEFAYITALKELLKEESIQKMWVADIKTVFWSGVKTQFEEDFPQFFAEPEKDDPTRGVREISTLLSSPATGAYCDDSPETQFFLLGLAQGGGKRICVRFWKKGTIAEFAKNIRQHFLDLEIKKPDYEPRYYSVNRLLKYASPLDDKERIPPNIAGDFMRAIIDGTPYPATLLQLVLRRIKSDRPEGGSGKWGANKPVRIALVKAYLNRYTRKYEPNEKELTMELDTGQSSAGYRLGRLFAALEKIQEEANPGLNATIRERYYGAACGSPVTVFPTLMRLKNHHLAKLENKGRVVNLERLIGEIIQPPFNDFPAHLSLHEQGKFAIGYYHQRQDFFTSKKDTDKE